MLIRLMLFVVLGFAAYAAIRWVRARRLGGSGGLNVVELNELLKLARGAPRLDQALKLRVLIVDSAAGDEREVVAARVDDSLRRLAEQERLLKKIADSLRQVNRKELEAKLDEARVDAETAEDSAVRGRHREHAESLARQSEQLDRLADRQDQLTSAAERIVAELRNLQLALLDAKSSEASLENPQVKHALSELSEAGENLRQQTAAEEEVNRMLRAATERQRAG